MLLMNSPIPLVTGSLLIKQLRTYWLSTYCVPGAVLEAGDTEVNKTENVLVFLELVFSFWGKDSTGVKE